MQLNSAGAGLDPPGLDVNSASLSDICLGSDLRCSDVVSVVGHQVKDLANLHKLVEINRLDVWSCDARIPGAATWSIQSTVILIIVCVLEKGNDKTAGVYIVYTGGDICSGQYFMLEFGCGDLYGGNQHNRIH